MFNRILNNITLSSDLADKVFGNILGDEFNGDKSFVATLRALLLPRVGQDEIRLSLGYSDYRETQIKNSGLRAVISAAFPSFRTGRLIVHNACAGSPDDRKALFDALDDPDSGFVELQSTFVEMTNIREFVADKMNARFYTDETNRVTVIVVESMTNRKWHYIQSFLPRYFKWYFENFPITIEETSLLASLTKKVSDDYEKLIETFASKFDMRTFLIKNVLGDLEKNSRKQQLRDLDRKIADRRSAIEDYMARYQEAINLLDDLNLRRMGILDIINNAGEGSELVEYFQSNKNLDPLSSEGRSFEFFVKTYIDSWDPDLYETMTKKPRSALFTNYRIENTIFKEQAARKKFLDSIFCDDPLLRIKIVGIYRLSLDGCSESYRNYRYPACYKDRLPNPHLQIFACLGNHRPIINRYLKNGDVIGAVEQCVASCKSLNFTESQTFQPFFGQVFNSNEKIIELPDRTSVTPEEAMQWLIDNEKKEEQENA